MTTLEILEKYLFAMVGTPYRWGGNNPVSGIDCSGLATEAMMAVGILPYGSDMNAQGLFDYFIKSTALRGAEFSSMGALAFYGKSQALVEHVAICINARLMIEAGGGDHLTLTREDAAARNAFVKVRPILYRRGLLGLLVPPYPIIF